MLRDENFIVTHSAVIEVGSAVGFTALLSVMGRFKVVRLVALMGGSVHETKPTKIREKIKVEIKATQIVAKTEKVGNKEQVSRIRRVVGKTEEAGMPVEANEAPHRLDNHDAS